ncbi:hypothetical protein T492DRAFT_1132139 [Pavlovales sp. CCMP2436]|nr:hypothetical protein T492DRAFT_1132139 [Pavlovales sp. CCMP2436]
MQSNRGPQEVQRLQARLAAAEKQLQSRQQEASHDGNAYGQTASSGAGERLVVTTGGDGGRQVQVQHAGGSSSAGLAPVGAYDGYAHHLPAAGGGASRGYGEPGASAVPVERLTVRMTSDSQGGMQRHAQYVGGGLNVAPGGYGGHQGYGNQHPPGSGRGQGRGYNPMGRGPAPPGGGRGGYQGNLPPGAGGGRDAPGGGRGGARGGVGGLPPGPGHGGRGNGEYGMGGAERGRGRGGGRGGSVSATGGGRGGGRGGRGMPAGSLQYDVHILAMNANVELLSEALSMSSGRREVSPF